MKPKPAPETGRLLVVDDNKVNRLLLGRSLEQQGHTVMLAENGRQAWELLQAESFDLVLLDVLMPEMDGYETLAQITADIHLRHIPVIMTSALDELDSVVKCIELGAEDYLTKPVNPVLLRARLNASLEKKRLRDQQRTFTRLFATDQVADDLETSGFALGGKHVEASVMFSDIRSFTAITESHSPDAVLELLNSYFALMFDAIGAHGGVVNQMIGDGLLAIFGAPRPRPDHREQAVRAALEMLELVEFFNQERARLNQIQIRIGVGIASGEVIAGYIGTVSRATYTCVGDTVNLAARLEAQTKTLGLPILIDENCRQGLSAALRADDEGKITVKGKAQPVQIYAVRSGQTV